MQHFKFAIFYTIGSLILAAFWGYSLGDGVGQIAAVTAVTLMLGIMEVSLSFDNAVVNASVLRDWNAFWRKIFLTIGILVAVFGMRLLFPLVIVSVTSEMSMIDVVKMALDHPQEYANRLTAHHAEISAFGGMFLLLVFLNYFMDDEKEVHWIHWIEEKMRVFGEKVGAGAALISLMVLLAAIQFIGANDRLPTLVAGVWGIVVYLLVSVLSDWIGGDQGETVGKVVKRGSIGAFIYLEMLDASFSFDGVIGAFAITKDIVVIMLGLGIGAMFVRSMTIFLVEKDTLNEYRYLEHGAHYAIGALAFIMLSSMRIHVPELVTGLIGVGLIGAAFWASILHNRRSALNGS